MRRIIIFVPLFAFGLGCGISAGQRQFIIDQTGVRVTEGIVKKLGEVFDDYGPEVSETIASEATKRGVKEEDAEAIGLFAVAATRNVTIAAVKEEIPELIESIAEDILPEADEEGGGTAGKLFGSLLGVLIMATGLRRA